MSHTQLPGQQSQVSSCKLLVEVVWDITVTTNYGTASFQERDISKPIEKDYLNFL